MSHWSFHGTFTALITPFLPGGERIDFPALERLVEAQIQGGVNGLVPCGTTGETPTLSPSEQTEVITCVAKTSAGRVPVIAGSGSNSTASSLRASQAALAAGADGVMIVTPYYNKPSQAGMRAHFRTVAAAIEAPIILYNIPGRSVVDLAADTTEAICHDAPNIVALKDATGNVLRCQELKRRLGNRLHVLCGDDALTLPMLAAGASGVISVSANVLPKQVGTVTRFMASGQLDEARAWHYQLLSFHAAMFIEPNPVPCKTALAHRGLIQPDVRLPWLPASDATRDRVIAELRAFETP